METVSAFCYSGSTITTIYKSLVTLLPLLPWTKSQLLVIGGRAVYRGGSVLLKISIGAVSAVVEAKTDFALPMQC